MTSVYLFQGNVQTSIKDKRAEALAQLKQHGKDMEDIENAIFVEGSKLKTVLKRNHEFERVKFNKLVVWSYENLCDLYYFFF